MSESTKPDSKPAAAPVIYRAPVAVRWSDMDAFNHVNNARYLTYLEEARIHWFERMDEEWVTDASAPIVAAIQMNYRMPVPYPVELVVELTRERIGGTSLTIGHRFVGADGRTLYGDGHVVVVWIDRRTGKPIPLPEAVVKAMARTV